MMEEVKLVVEVKERYCILLCSHCSRTTTPEYVRCGPEYGKYSQDEEISPAKCGRCGTSFNHSSLAYRF